MTSHRSKTQIKTAAPRREPFSHRFTSGTERLFFIVLLYSTIAMLSITGWASAGMVPLPSVGSASLAI